MKPFSVVLPQQNVRQPLCTYFSQNKDQLLEELRLAYRSCRSSSSVRSELQLDQQLLALVVPHGAACDGFHVAASAYSRLNAFLKRKRCQHLTAVLLGTEHRGSVPVATSRLDWSTPLGTAPVDTAAVDFLAREYHIPVNEAPHASEHSLENQLPFLLHAAAASWDMDTAACEPHTTHSTPSTPAAATAAAAGAARAGGSAHRGDAAEVPGGAAALQPASLSIVPISIGYLGNQLQQIEATGNAVRHLLQHLRQQQQQQQDAEGAGGAGGSSGSAGGGCHEVVLVVTTDFTHAGPWYRELPPAGMSLEAYMRSQDTPVLKAVEAASVKGLLAAAAGTRNSMCGLYPLAVALQALYGSSSSGGGSTVAAPGGGTIASVSTRSVPVPAKPLLLDYRAAHTIFPRPDSTGFAAFVVYKQ